MNCGSRNQDNLLARRMVTFIAIVVVNSILFAVGLCDKFCFDAHCFTLPSSAINRTILGECACDLQLPSTVKELTHIVEISQENCTTVFSNAEGSTNMVVNLKDLSYETEPTVVYDDAISDWYASLVAVNYECTGWRYWRTTKRNSTFIWDFGGLRTMSRVEFRNQLYVYRFVIDFEVSVSRYSGTNVIWTTVLHVGDLEKPISRCEPIQHYTFNSIVGRQIKVQVYGGSSGGAAINHFRVY